MENTQVKETTVADFVANELLALSVEIEHVEKASGDDVLEASCLSCS